MCGIRVCLEGRKAASSQLDYSQRYCGRYDESGSVAGGNQGLTSIIRTVRFELPVFQPVDVTGADVNRPWITAKSVPMGCPRC